MANGFGSTVYITTLGTTVSSMTGSIISFDIEPQAEIKEAVSGLGNFLAVAALKRKDVVNTEIILTGSGSVIPAKNIFDTATVTCPAITSLNGTWCVTAAKTMLKAEDFAVQNCTFTRYYTDAGTTIP